LCLHKILFRAFGPAMAKPSWDQRLILTAIKLNLTAVSYHICYLMNR